MEVPRELRWIGPLFFIVYSILWARRGVMVLLALFVSPFIVFFAIPNLIVIVLVSIAIYKFGNKHWVSGFVLILSLAFSGIMIEYIPIPWSGPYPPPPVISVFPVTLLTPFLILPTMLAGLSLGINLAAILSLFLLIILPYPTFLVVWLFEDEKIDPVKAMLWLVIILLSWTLLVFPFGQAVGAYVVLTPLPLGPLFALNILPYVEDINSFQKQPLDS